MKKRLALIALAVLAPGGIGVGAFFAWKWWRNRQEAPDVPTDDLPEPDSTSQDDLHPNIRAAVTEYQTAYPNSSDVISSLRTLDAQAHAMAKNVLSDRTYIADTYANEAAKRPLQDWVDGSPGAVDEATIATGLLGVLQTYTPAMLHSLTWHIATGDDAKADAADFAHLDPAGQVFADADARVAKLESIASEWTNKGFASRFLRYEGKDSSGAPLERWHLQVASETSAS